MPGLFADKYRTNLCSSEQPISRSTAPESPGISPEGLEPLIGDETLARYLETNQTESETPETEPETLTTGTAALNATLTSDLFVCIDIPMKKPKDTRPVIVDCRKLENDRDLCFCLKKIYTSKRELLGFLSWKGVIRSSLGV